VLKILELLLQFNPYFRSSPAELLKSKEFDSIRNKEKEAGADYRIDLEVDQIGSFDYE